MVTFWGTRNGIPETDEGSSANIQEDIVFKKLSIIHFIYSLSNFLLVAKSSHGFRIG